MNKDTKKLHILIADDHELVRRGRRALLHSKRGWKVVGEAVDGRVAVEKAKTLKPDVAVLDIEMPNLDGLDATCQMRVVAPNVQVLILTMHKSDQMVRRVLVTATKSWGPTLTKKVGREVDNQVAAPTETRTPT